MIAPTGGPMNAHSGERVLGRIAATEKLGAFQRLTLEVCGWGRGESGSKMPAPGQFALLQAEPSRCFLPRAFSISDYDKGSVSFLVASVGEGSHELSALPVGSDVWLLGPLGRGFDLRAIAAGPSAAVGAGRGLSPTRLVVVAGGAGLAPFPFLLRRIGDLLSRGRETRKAPVREVLVLVGYRDQSQVPGGRVLLEAAERLRGCGVACRVIEISEDGSCGPVGLVTAPLAKNLAEGDQVMVCGPQSMAAAVWDVCRKTPRVRTWFSLEAGMACGVGACHGCVIRLADGTMARVCFEGPVFSGDEVFAGEPVVGSGAVAASGPVRPGDACEGAAGS